MENQREKNVGNQNGNRLAKGLFGNSWHPNLCNRDLVTFCQTGNNKSSNSPSSRYSGVRVCRVRNVGFAVNPKSTVFPAISEFRSLGYVSTAGIVEIPAEGLDDWRPP